MSSNLIYSGSANLSPYRGEQQPNPQLILFERRDNSLYAILPQEYAIEPSALEEGQRPFITTVRFREELGAIIPSTSAPVVPISPPTATAQSIALTQPPPPTVLATSFLIQANAGSQYFSFGQSDTHFPNHAPFPALQAQPPNALQQPPLPPIQVTQHPMASTDGTQAIMVHRLSKQRTRNGLFGVFSGFFGPQLIDPPEHWQHYDPAFHTRNKRNTSEGDQSLIRALVFGCAVAVIAAALTRI